MKKIEKKEDKLKKEQKQQKILCIVLGLILLGSTLGFAFMNNSSNTTNGYEKREYGTRTFVRGMNYWELEDNGNMYYFNYLPDELLNISVNYNGTMSDFQNSVFYYVGNFNNRLLTNMQNYVLRYQEAKLNDSDKDVPLKYCNSTDNIVVFENSNITSIYSVDNCVYISGDTSKASDLFFYKLLGIV